MKLVVLVALLAALGCSKKASPSSDCEPSIGKGLDSFLALAKSRGGAAQVQEQMVSVIGKLKTTLTQRCVEDKWPPEVAQCFTTVSTMKDIQACQSKLSPEQQGKISTAVREVMLNARGPRMPPGVAGHPPVLQGSTSGPPTPQTTEPGAAAPASGPVAGSGGEASGSAAPVNGGGAPASGSAAKEAAAPASGW